MVLLMGALFRHRSQTALSALKPQRAPVEDKAAAQTLDEAVANLQPERIGWTEATLWQKVNWDDFAYQAEGRYLAGPGHHLHLSLTVQVGRTHGELQMICDGTTLWEDMQIQGKERLVSRAELARVLECLGRDTVPPQVRDEFIQEMCVCGLGPWLQSLRRQMVVTHQEFLSWNMHDVMRLTLEWTPHNAEVLAPPQKPWPAYLPRKCLLYLDAETSWPYRLEWWGPGKVPDRENQIYQIEFRDPILHQSVPPERCTRECTLPPGSEEETDRTESYASAVKARTLELTKEKKRARR
jgi:hypothetical protein